MIMLKPVLYNKTGPTPLYKQIARTIARQIEEGTLQNNCPLASINVFSFEHEVARDTVEKAYNELRAGGYITSVPGKGYYVISREEKKLKLLLVLDKLNSYNKTIYNSLLEIMGDKAEVDLHIHHHSPSKLNTIISAGLGKYDQYIIIPHFKNTVKSGDYASILNMIPAEELLLLDHLIPGLTKCKSVYQDYPEDIFRALVSVADTLHKYQALSIILRGENYCPAGIISGLQDFCTEYNQRFTILSNEDEFGLCKATLYIVIEDEDLSLLLKKIRKSTYIIGKDIGVISFNESELKELLDITVMSTDFKKMGETVAELILSNYIRQIKNPFLIIKRGSL